MTRLEALRSFLAKRGPAELLRLAARKTRAERVHAAPAAQGVNLALQGGGALGAFTWGVLDRLNEEALWRVRAISGTSAGALNAAVYVTGLARAGRDGASQALKAFWSDVSHAATFAHFLATPRAVWPMALSGNPLEEILARHVDIAALRSPRAPRLFLAATHVASATARIFTNEDVSLPALLASACIPTLHPTVIIDGEAYWDGGFSANPPLQPLMDTGAERTVLVRLIRSASDTLPRDAAQIDARIKMLLFARPLEDELARLAAGPYRDHALDEIDATEHTSSARFTSAPTPRLVHELFEKGREAASDYFAAQRRLPHEADTPVSALAGPSRTVA